MYVISPPSSLLRSVLPSTMLLPLVSSHSFLLLLLAAEFLSSFAAPYISSFCYCLPFLICHCCPLPSFFDLNFSVSSLFLVHLGTSPLMNRGSFLPPPLPFIHTLRPSSGCRFFVFLMHERKSPSTCLSLRLPPPFTAKYSWFWFSCTISSPRLLTVVPSFLRLIPTSRLLTTVATSFFDRY